MTAIDKTGATTFESLGLTLPDESAQPRNQLGQEDFLQLMLAQLRHQDPLQPLENGDFLGQMAQFSTVSGIQDLNETFSHFASSLQSNRALQASSLVGRAVMVPTSQARLEAGGSVSGAVELSEPASALTITVSDASGQTVRSFELGPQTGGVARFTWDGLNNSGQPAPAGDYFIRVDASVNGETVTLDSLVESKVESVSLGQGGGDDILLNVAGIGPIALSDINEIF